METSPIYLERPYINTSLVDFLLKLLTKPVIKHFENNWIRHQMDQSASAVVWHYNSNSIIVFLWKYCLFIPILSLYFSKICYEYEAVIVSMIMRRILFTFGNNLRHLSRLKIIGCILKKRMVSFFIFLLINLWWYRVIQDPINRIILYTQLFIRL